jgi:hypothetical protein
MRKSKVVLALLLLCCVSANAGDKLKGSTTLKDLHPEGTTDKKQKNQIYDFIFVAPPNQYTCRTSHDTKLNATDYVVGGNIRYEIDKNKVKLKNDAGKEAKCTVVRVENAATAAMK